MYGKEMTTSPIVTAARMSRIARDLINVFGSDLILVTEIDASSSSLACGIIVAAEYKGVLFEISVYQIHFKSPDVFVGTVVRYASYQASCDRRKCDPDRTSIAQPLLESFLEACSRVDAEDDDTWSKVRELTTTLRKIHNLEPERASA